MGRREQENERARHDNPLHLIQWETEYNLYVDDRCVGMRLDQFLAKRMPWRSRTSIQKLLQERQVTVDGIVRKRYYRMSLEEKVAIPLPPPPPEATSEALEAIPLDILYEDEHMVVLNKQPGICVHPVGRKRYNTLINALHLRYRRPDDPAHDIIPMLCHRLDQDTSGVLVAAKTLFARRELYYDFAHRRAQKEYLALVHGRVPDDLREINLPIGADAESDLHIKRAVRHDVGDAALTTVSVEEHFRRFTLVRLGLKTGKQHQLRVHLSAVGHPILCDALYGDAGPFLRGPHGLGDPADEVLIGRQALHAAKLILQHPTDDHPLTLEAPLPEDMARTLRALRGAASA